MVIRYSKDETTEKSLQHSIKDGISFSVMGGVSESYFSAFAVFLKASAPQIGLLASMPPLLASFVQIFSVWLGRVSGVRRPIIVAGALIQVAALMAVAVLPYNFPDYAFPLLLLSATLYFIGPNLGAPLWASLMGGLIPEGVRGRFFARRSRLSSIASFSALLTAGVILQLFDMISATYLGFLTIFCIGMLARGVSAWHLHQIHEPTQASPVEALDLDGIPTISSIRENPNFTRFSLFFATMQFAVAISGPFVVVYLLRDLQYTYLQLTANTAASVLMQFMVMNRWGRLSDLFGNQIIVRVTGFAIPFVPLLWVLSNDFWYLILVQTISGLIWSGYSLSTSNFLYDLTPQAKRGGLMAFHNLLAAIAVFLGASAGGLLVINLPTSISLGSLSIAWSSVFYGVFICSSVLRLLVALSILPHLQEVRLVKPMTYHGLIFRVTRFSPISGVMFDVVSRVKKRNLGRKASEKTPADSDPKA